MDKLNLTPTINLQRPDKDGKYPVRIRSTVKRKVSYYPTGISVLKNQFKDRQVIKHINKDLLNAEIRLQMAQIEKNALEGKLNIRKPDNDFYKFCDAKVKQQKGEDAHGTWKHKSSYLNMLKKYRTKLRFDEITPSFMLDYENYLRKEGNAPTTIWGKVKFITTMINAAIADRVIFENPKEKYKSKPYVDPERSFLTDQEIEAIEQFVLKSKNGPLVKVGNWFLFGCYTGLRYSDVKMFDKKKIVGGRIILRTEKSKTDVSIKIHPRLKALLKRIEPNVYTNQQINGYLKIIAAACDIDKKLSFHISRHTYAVYFLNHGGSMESLSKLLGHTSLKTTSIYGKITNQRLDAETDKVWK